MSFHQVGVVRPVYISSFFYMISLTTYHASFSFTVTCGIRAACNEYVIASAEEDCRTRICSELDANNDCGEENDAITAKRSRCVADGRRHASNIADDELGRQGGRGYAVGADERNRTTRKLIIQLIVIQRSQTKAIVIAQGIR